MFRNEVRSSLMATSDESRVDAVLVVCFPGTAGTEVAELVMALRPLSANVSAEEKESGTWGAWQWMLPAAVMIYLGKGLIDGFLKEIGTAAAKSLREAIVAAFRRGKGTETRWANVHEMEAYLKDIEAAEQSGHDPATIRRPGLSCVPLSISCDLPYGIEARFVLPHELDEDQVRQALDELRAALPMALARDRQRAEAMPLYVENPAELSERISYLGDLHMGREATLVFDPALLTWIDADEAHRQEIRQSIENRRDQSGGGEYASCPTTQV